LLELLAADFIEISSSGNRVELDKILAILPAEEGWSIVTKDYECHPLSDGIVRLTYRAFVQHSATDPGVYSIRTSLWKNVGGKWKMEFHQATKTAPFALGDARRE
jgi:hypothetical protein